MTPAEAHEDLIPPTLAKLGARYATPEAQLMLLAIGIQESGFRCRDQGDPRIIGPARGFWQFEQRGGCAEFEKAALLEVFRKAAVRLGYATDRHYTWIRSGEPEGDRLACIMARAVLFLDPRPLPGCGDRAGAYEQYLARWRPGKPSARRWATAYATAMRIVSANTNDVVP